MTIRRTHLSFCDDKKDTLIYVQARVHDVCKIFSWIRTTKLKIHTMEFCNFLKDSVSPGGLFVPCSLTVTSSYVAAKADSSFSNRRAWLSRSLATGLCVDSRITVVGDWCHVTLKLRLAPISVAGPEPVAPLGSTTMITIRQFAFNGLNHITNASFKLVNSTNLQNRVH